MLAHNLDKSALPSSASYFSCHCTTCKFILSEIPSSCKIGKRMLCLLRALPLKPDTINGFMKK